MKIKNTTLSSLKPSPSNVRVHSDEQINSVVASMEEFGYTNPILVDEDNNILAGHCRYEALTRMEIEKVKVLVVAGLSDIQKRAYMLADNKLAMNSDWDVEALNEELLALQESDEIDFDLLGFNEQDMADIEEELLALAEAAELDESGFKPEINPSSKDYKEVDGDDLDKTAEALGSKFDSTEEETVEVVCPHCAETFLVRL